MNIDNLLNAKKLIDTELNNNINSKELTRGIFQTRLSFISDNLRSLISLATNPSKHEIIKRLCDPDEK